MVPKLQPQKASTRNVSVVQTKLTVNTPGDRYEREADAMADQVMRMPNGASLSTPSMTPLAGSIQHKCAACGVEKELLQRKEQNASLVAPPSISSQLANTHGQGNPLPTSTQSFMGKAFGTDFGQVRVHTDANAAKMNQGLNARAFTHGSDIYFNRGQYTPESAEGKRLLAHELTHVVQQGGVIKEQSVQREMDVSVTSPNKDIKIDLSIGIFGPNASNAIATSWESAINRFWTDSFNHMGKVIQFKMNCKVKNYGDPLSLGSVKEGSLGWWVSTKDITEDNEIYVEQNGFRSYVASNCTGKDYSCGRWAADAADIVAAHETGHLMYLNDKYFDIFGQSIDKAGFEKDIMANFWNDNGQTTFKDAMFRLWIYNAILGMKRVEL